MRIRVLGSGAGGGFPQWNCRCRQCEGLRSGRMRARARTQASIAVQSFAGDLVLINASPDIRQQIEAWPALHPRPRPAGEGAPEASARDTPIAAVCFTNADIDHVGGLLTLRESQPLALFATARVRRAIVEHNAIFRALALRPGQSTWTPLVPGAGPAPLTGVGGRTLGLAVEAIAVPGKAPAYLGGVLDPPDSPEDTIALRVVDRERGRSLVYAPGVKRLDPELVARLVSADVLLLDGTCWRDDELPAAGIDGKTASAMGHLAIDGPEGSLAQLRAARGVRKIYTHINNTNPILDEDSPERRAVEAAGIEVAFDGMEIALG